MIRVLTFHDEFRQLGLRYEGKMEKTMKVVLVIGSAMIITGFLIGGRYQGISMGNLGGIYIIDRLTGTLSFCIPSKCEIVKQIKSNSGSSQH